MSGEIKKIVMIESLSHHVAGDGPPFPLVRVAAEHAGILTPQAKAVADRGRRIIPSRGTETTSRTTKEPRSCTA